MVKHSQIVLGVFDHLMRLALEGLKIMKNAFYFLLKVRFVIKILKFLSLLFGQVGKRLNGKAKVIFKIYDATSWTTNYYNTHNAEYLKK